MDDTESQKTLPKYVLYIVVISRLFYIMVASIIVFYPIATMLSLPVFPSPMMELSGHMIGMWVGLFFVVSTIVMAIGFKFHIWIILSWMTAYTLSGKARQVMKEEFDNIRNIEDVE